MSIAICTLFEGNYHFGVAALVNSLYEKGFRGDIYAGYKGQLPKWASARKEIAIPTFKGASVLEFKTDLKLYFLPLDTNYHLTNYKPDFMLRLFNDIGLSMDGIVYFDPDIVLVAPWSFIENWVNSGVAVSEDVNSPLEEFHPKRVSWRKIYSEFNVKLKFYNSIYVNGGFLGVNSKNIRFLEQWKVIQEIMGKKIGGLDYSAFPGRQLPPEANGPFAPFGRTDQDALNIAIESDDFTISYLRKEGMGFKIGIVVMYHAIGSNKPWSKNFLKNILYGNIPGQADRAFWGVTNGLIVTCSTSKLRFKILIINLALFIGRFYRKSK